jgi:hypothetical protein
MQVSIHQQQAKEHAAEAHRTLMHEVQGRKPAGKGV